VHQLEERCQTHLFHHSHRLEGHLGGGHCHPDVGALQCAQAFKHPGKNRAMDRAVLIVVGPIGHAGVHLSVFEEGRQKDLIHLGEGLPDEGEYLLPIPGLRAHGFEARVDGHGDIQAAVHQGAVQIEDDKARGVVAHGKNYPLHLRASR
jgi:hypothetical protein